MPTIKRIKDANVRRFKINTGEDAFLLDSIMIHVPQKTAKKLE